MELAALGEGAATLASAMPCRGVPAAQKNPKAGRGCSRNKAAFGPSAEAARQALQPSSGKLPLTDPGIR